MLLAAGGTLPAPRVTMLVLACMVAGRSAAMGINRIVDARIDAENPRTRMREIPAGLLSVRAMVLFVAASTALFLAAAAALNRLTLLLAPVALLFFALYPYTKRVTALCHFVLGACLGAAPVGAWVAVRGDVGLPPLLLGSAVLCWVAGFDILYALQDEAHDRAHGLHSVPAALGARGARGLARLLHLIAVALFGATGLVSGLGIPYQAGIAVAAGLLVASHWLVRRDVERIDVAFFTMNSWLSVVVLAGTIADLLAGGPAPR